MPNWKKVIVSGSNAILNNITASGNISSSGLLYASLSYDDTPVTDGVVAYDISTGQLYYTGSYGNSGEDTDWYVNDGALGTNNDFVTSSRLVKVAHQGLIANSGSVSQTWGLNDHYKNTLVGFDGNGTYESSTSTTPGGYTGKVIKGPRTHVTAEAWDTPETRIYPVCLTARGTGSGNFGLNEGYPYNYLVFGHGFYYEFISGSGPVDGGDEPEEDTGLGGDLVIDGGVTVQNDTRKFSLSFTSESLPPLTGSGEAPPSIVIRPQGGIFFFETGSTLSSSGSYLATSASARIVYNTSSHHLSIKVGSKQADDLTEVLYISKSGDNPRIGVGVTNPLKAFDFKDVSDTNRGAEMLIRTSRPTKGADPNDEAGRINFIIDSGSYTKVETSGSVAEVIALVDEADASGVRGSLSFRVSAQKTEDSVEKIRITPDRTQVTGSFVISGSNSFINIGPAEFSGSVAITSSLEVDGAVTHNNTTTHYNNVLINTGLLDVNSTSGAAIRGSAGLSVGDLVVPGAGRLRVTDYSMLLGGVHIGGTTDPGTDNLLVDGTTTLVGDTIISGSDLYFPNLTAGAVGNYDKLLIVDSTGQTRTLAKSSVPYIEVFDGATPTNQTLVMFSGSTGDVANATGVSYNAATGWNFSGVGSVYDITADDIFVTNDLTAIGDISAANGSFSGDLTVDGNITANQYIVSSSVTYMTQSFSSGSTIFGDTLDDTHQFTGSVDITGSLTIDGMTYPTTDGNDGQVLLTDGSGVLSFGDVKVYAQVKNISGVTLAKGTPVHATASASPPSGNVSEVIAASASLASSMPATFILDEELAHEAEGRAILSGFINGVDTSAFKEGDVVYVGENGGYTTTKPTGTNLIQNLGIITKVDASNGAGYIYGSGRSNDVPNITEGYVWVGNSSGVATPTPTSSFDTFPYTGSAVISGSLEVIGDTNITGSINLQNSSTNRINFNNAAAINQPQIRLKTHNTGITMRGNDVLALVSNGSGMIGMKKTSATSINFPSAAKVGFTTNTSVEDYNPETYFRRYSSGVIGIGYGAVTSANLSGSLILTNITASGHISASTYYGDGSNLTGINSGSWDGIFTGSAEITGSTTIIGDITSNTISTISTTLASDSATNVDTFNTSSYTGAIYDYILIDTTVGARAGQFMIAQDSGSVTFTDNSTRHLFDGTAPEISGQVNGANVEVQVTNGNGYTFKSFVKKL